MFYVEVKQLSSDSSLRKPRVDLEYSTHPTYKQVFADLRASNSLLWDVNTSHISFQGTGEPRSLDDKIALYVNIWVNWNGCRITPLLDFGIMVTQS